MPPVWSQQKAPVVLAGDYNVMPTDLDVYKPERWRDDALFRPETRGGVWSPSRARMGRRGAHDASQASAFTPIWDYFRNAYGRDAGLRIDHLLLNPALALRLRNAGVDRDVRGWEKTSDHAPTWVELA